MITADRNLRHQQTLAGRRIAVLVLPTNNWNIIRRNIPATERAIGIAAAGSYYEVTFDST